MFLYFRTFLSSAEISGVSMIFFLVFELLFTSGPSPLQPFCHHSPYFTLPIYLEAIFSRQPYNIANLLYLYILYYVACLSNISYFFYYFIASLLCSCASADMFFNLFYCVSIFSLCNIWMIPKE